MPVRRALSRQCAGALLLWQQLRRDELLRNSFYIMLATATMAALGLIFWLVNSRLYTPAEIGAATSLISAISLISYLSLFGFNTTIVRFLPSSLDRNRDINAGLIVVLLAGLTMAAAFVALLPWMAPELDFVRRSLPLAAAFCVMAAVSGANLFTDSIFIAVRAARYNFLLDGIVQGGTKVVLCLVFVGMGTYGIVASSGVAAGVAVGGSLLVMRRLVDYRPRLRLDWHAVRGLAGFSAASYVANMLNLVPILVLPLVVLSALGAEEAGYYFVSFQIANLLNAIAYAVCQSLLAEGSYEDAELNQLVRRSAKVLGWAIVPAAVGVAVVGRWLLMIFGGAYSRHGWAVLTLLALAAVAVASYCWVGTLLKFSKQLSMLIWMEVVYAAVIVGLAIVLAHRGLVWVGFAWLAGNVAAAAVGGLGLVAHRRRSSVTSGASPNPAELEVVP